MKNKSSKPLWTKTGIKQTTVDKFLMSVTPPQEPQAGSSRDIPEESIVIIGHRVLACYCL